MFAQSLHAVELLLAAVNLLLAAVDLTFGFVGKDAFVVRLRAEQFINLVVATGCDRTDKRHLRRARGELVLLVVVKSGRGRGERGVKPGERVVLVGHSARYRDGGGLGLCSLAAS
jgi:hypothetical protein